MAGKRSEIGKIIAGWRVQNDYQLKDFAHLMGVSQAFMSKVEYGHDPLPVAWLERVPPELVGPLAEQLRQDLKARYEAQLEAIATVERRGEPSDLSACSEAPGMDEILEKQAGRRVLKPSRRKG